MDQPLEEVIQNHSGLLFLLFAGGGSEEEEHSRLAAREAVAAQPPEARALFMEVCLSSWTDVAASQGVHGVPAILVFKNGRLLLRRLGRTDGSTLSRLVAQAQA